MKEVDDHLQPSGYNTWTWQTDGCMDGHWTTAKSVFTHSVAHDKVGKWTKMSEGKLMLSCAKGDDCCRLAAEHKISFCDILMNKYRKFFNPEFPEITCTQSQYFRISKIGRNPGFRIPGLQSLLSKVSRYPNCSCVCYAALTNISKFMRFIMYQEKQQERLKQLNC